MTHTNLDMNSVQGFVSSCAFILMGHLSQFIDSMDVSFTLQHTSYSVAILVGIDTLMGNPIKGLFTKLWKKLLGRK